MSAKIDLIVIEDEDSICAEYREKVKNFSSLFLIDATGSTQIALEQVKEFHPRAIILDLELHKGYGNGITFLQDLSALQLKPRPYILVVTNNISSITHSLARKLGADFIITKNQPDYSVDMVLALLSSFNDMVEPLECCIDDTPNISDKLLINDYNQKLSNKILVELDLIGISPKVKGRQYLKDGIELICEKHQPNVCSVIGEKYSKTSASVERAMQTAINQAWRNTDIETLSKNYTAYINPKRGIPTVTEFIYYYADKIKRSI